MASDALEAVVRPGQREAGRAVIKRRWPPHGGRVARRAVVIEIVRRVIGIRYCRKIALMTGEAGRGGIRIPGGVTAQALKSGMPAGQRELCLAMIKRRRIPGRVAVTGCAVMTKIICSMIRIGRAGKIAGMTTIAGRWRTGIRLRVTGNALQRSMCPGQHKTG